MPGRAHAEEQGRILADVLARARVSAPRGVVVFDLDSTMLDNRPRQARILRDYGQTWRVPKLLQARADHLRGWDLAAQLAVSGLDEREVREHEARFRRFWTERFFTSEYCRLDVPVAGAPEYARSVAAAGARIAYVTGRPREMRPGTIEAFRRFGFPLPEEGAVALLMKPRATLGDDVWKAAARLEVERLGPVVAAFDNEPAHVNGYALAWPGASCVHLDTDHSDRPIEVLERVPSVRDFRLLVSVSAGATAATAGAP